MVVVVENTATAYQRIKQTLFRCGFPVTSVIFAVCELPHICSPCLYAPASLRGDLPFSSPDLHDENCPGMPAVPPG